MKIEHIAMYVSDLERERAFLRNISVQKAVRCITIGIQVFGRTFSAFRMAQGLKS